MPTSQKFLVRACYIWAEDVRTCTIRLINWFSRYYEINLKNMVFSRKTHLKRFSYWLCRDNFTYDQSAKILFFHVLSPKTVKCCNIFCFFILLVLITKFFWNRKVWFFEPRSFFLWKWAEDCSLPSTIILLILRIELILFTGIFSISNTCKICKK